MHLIIDFNFRNVERFATIESGIIFMQFFGVVIVLSTILFQVQMVCLSTIRIIFPSFIEFHVFIERK